MGAIAFFGFFRLQFLTKSTTCWSSGVGPPMSPPCTMLQITANKRTAVVLTSDLSCSTINAFISVVNFRSLGLADPSMSTK
ncbi:hypothetical protein PR002_g14823 [Phytophthora rubi]|uniref:Secreted protein n=1 Tax=Phytophthora rubi TaxID=129364 RepID=A0A6A3L8I0_9STRA|nr:hypothetical protein PR002_g14823 [Phytophthora rubi]